MTAFRQVIKILDDAIGGADAQIAMHGAFWRGLTRDEFVMAKVFGRELVVVGQGANSNLIKALKGEVPFGRDLPDPPSGARFKRMPAGLPPVSSQDIAVLQRWIDQGCPGEPVPEDPVPSPALTWRITSAPQARRYDDISFVTPELGWAVNSDGSILHTTDGGDTWKEQFSVGSYLRCVGFASESVGWVGTVTPGEQLFATRDGGATWSPVSDLPPQAPALVCGLCVVNESVVYASGTNYPHPTFTDPPRMMKTVDGGASWTVWDMSEHASLLVDTYFSDPDRGWVVGGKEDQTKPPGDPPYFRQNIQPVVLYTEDGGRTWVDRVENMRDSFPLGEWGWKLQFLDERVGFVSLENFNEAAILKTTDGGLTWERLQVNDPQGNANLEGVGFVTEDQGWVGGWGGPDFQGGFSSETQDGGREWLDANHVGLFINRFRFFGRPVTTGYASGLGVYKYSAEPAPPVRPGTPAPTTRFLESNEPRQTRGPLRVPVHVPQGTSHLVIDIFERFGARVRRLLDEREPSVGERQVEWDVTDDAGDPLNAGNFILRATLDGTSESQILTVRR